MTSARIPASRPFSSQGRRRAAYLVTTPRPRSNRCRAQSAASLSPNTDGQPRSADVVANRDSLIASMSANVFWEVLADHPIVAATILKQLTKQIRDLTERVFEFSTLAVRNRIQAELLRLAREHAGDKDSAVISPALTHAEFASRVSTHREAVTRELNNLARAGLIEQHGRVLIIRNIGQLARLVEEVLGE